MALELRGLDEKASLLIEQGRTDAALVEMRRAFDVDVPMDHPNPDPGSTPSRSHEAFGREPFAPFPALRHEIQRHEILHGPC